jgi:anthranilate 1,2-dioxygenase small subunit
MFAIRTSDVGSGDLTMVATGSYATEDIRLLGRLSALYEDYAACLDDDELERWPAFFTDEALYQIIARENRTQSLALAAIYCDGIGMIRDRAAAVRECTLYMPRPLRHMIGGIRIMSCDERRQVTTRANFTVYESPIDSEPRIFMVGRYEDTIVDDGDSLLFRERLCIYDNYRIHTSLIFPV